MKKKYEGKYFQGHHFISQHSLKIKTEWLQEKCGPFIFVFGDEKAYTEE
jgi:hypothetical protein